MPRSACFVSVLVASTRRPAPDTKFAHDVRRAASWVLSASDVELACNVEDRNDGRAAAVPRDSDEAGPLQVGQRIVSRVG